LEERLESPGRVRSPAGWLRGGAQGRCAALGSVGLLGEPCAQRGGEDLRKALGRRTRSGADSGRDRPSTRSARRRSSSRRSSRIRLNKSALALRNWRATRGRTPCSPTTTSSLSIAELARASGRPDRFVGLHVFNPVPRMEPDRAGLPSRGRRRDRARARALCEALGKTAVEVPDIPASSSTGSSSLTSSAPLT